VPSVFCVGAVQDNVAAPTDEPFTAIAKGASDVLVLPSLTLTTTFEYVPTLALVGVPESWPVDVLKLAHAGLFAIEYVNVSPSASAAVGRKL
jgi:hypothetical protein